MTIGGSAWVFALDVLAAYRLTRLVTADTITGGARWRVIRWAYRRAGTDDAILPLGPNLDDMVDADLAEAGESHELPPKLAQLVRCRWCAGAWVSAGVASARWFAPTQWGFFSYLLAVAALSVLVAGLED